ATLKNEMYHRYRFATRARARFAVAEYIEVFYNGNGCTAAWATRLRPLCWPSTTIRRTASAPLPRDQRNQPRPCPRTLTQPSRALLLWHCQMARTLTGHGSSDSRLEDAATLTNRHPTRWRDGNRSGPIAQQMTKRRKEGDGSR